MGHQRSEVFAKLDGTLMRFNVFTDEVREVARALSEERLNITSSQLELVLQLVTRVIGARDEVVRRTLSEAIEAAVHAARLPGDLKS